MQLLAALLVGASVLPLVSNTVGAVGPVKIKSCDVAYIDESPGSGGFGGVMTTSLQFTNGVTLTVMNTSTKPVTSFTVKGSYNTYKVTDTWSGKLLPGAQLSIFKHYQQLQYVNDKAICMITKATYADGSTWTSNGTP